MSPQLLEGELKETGPTPPWSCLPTLHTPPPPQSGNQNLPLQEDRVSPEDEIYMQNENARICSLIYSITATINLDI